MGLPARALSASLRLAGGRASQWQAGRSLRPHGFPKKFIIAPHRSYAKVFMLRIPQGRQEYSGYLEYSADALLLAKSEPCFLSAVRGFSFIGTTPQPANARLETGNRQSRHIDALYVILAHTDQPAEINYKKPRIIRTMRHFGISPEPFLILHLSFP